MHFEVSTQHKRIGCEIVDWGEGEQKLRLKVLYYAREMVEW